MKFTFPSREFDEAVAALCHGTASDEQARALNELLRSDAAARDEYILRAELHSRLASEPDLFPQASEAKAASLENIVPIQTPRGTRTQKASWIFALAACITLLAAGWWGLQLSRQNDRKGTTSKAVAMLNRVVDAHWDQRDETPRLGAP